MFKTKLINHPTEIESHLEELHLFRRSNKRPITSEDLVAMLSVLG